MSTPFLPRFSARSSHLREASILRALTLKVNALSDGINLGQGVCDLDMPPLLARGAIDSIQHDRATYTSFQGLKEFRQEIVRRNQERYGLTYRIDEVVVTTGASGAWSAALMTLTDPGDEVLLFEPFYPYHNTCARLAGCRVTPIPLSLGEAGIDWPALEKALSRNPRLLVLNTPSNPLGKVWTRHELEHLSRLLSNRQTTVVTDEIYEDLIYDGKTHLPPACIEGLYPRTVTISGVSKSFSVTGWRLGWLCAPAPLARAIGPVFDVLVVCAARPLQKGAALALRELPESYYRALREGYERRREKLKNALLGAGFSVQVPEGAYYMLADYSGRYGALEPLEACFKLLDEFHLAAIPGTIFYADRAPPVLRFQFAVKDAILDEVALRLGA